MALIYIDQANLQGKRVLARFDFNVPLDENQNITDTQRIDLALPTIQHILEQGASKLVMMSHLGRPKGKPQKKFSLEPVATYLAEKLQQKVTLTESPVDNGLESLLNLNETKIVLLENLRFDAREEKDDGEFAMKLSKFGDVFVNDAFGAAHRKHASVHEINRHFKGHAFGGLLLKKEIQALTHVIETFKRPYIGVIGGAKISDKIKTIEKLLTVADNLLIGGAMAYPFLKAQGFSVGKSLCHEEDVKLAKSILATKASKKLLLPQDHLCSDSIDGSAEKSLDQNIDDHLMGLDIGPKTLESYAKVISGAQTIFWNGPMGLFEKEQFSGGTIELAKNISQNNQAYRLVGGGDSVSAIKKAGLEQAFSHVSTGGGASLEFIEKGQLPGVQALKFGVS
jgi:phosphoglycerate kinase